MSTEGQKLAGVTNPDPPKAGLENCVFSEKEIVALLANRVTEQSQKQIKTWIMAYVVAFTIAFAILGYKISNIISEAGLAVQKIDEKVEAAVKDQIDAKIKEYDLAPRLIGAITDMQLKTKERAEDLEKRSNELAAQIEVLKKLQPLTGNELQTRVSFLEQIERAMADNKNAAAFVKNYGPASLIVGYVALTADKIEVQPKTRHKFTVKRMGPVRNLVSASRIR